MKLFRKMEDINPQNVPQHIGFIMDGNGRWAKKRGLPRSAGHREGSIAMRRVCEACREFGVKTVTVYALSTENLQRSESEVNYIMGLAVEFIEKELQNALKYDLKINIIGDINHNRIDEKTRSCFLNAMETTKNCKTYVLNIAFVYGGRDEIIRGINKLLAEGKTSITEEDFGNYLYTAGQNDPDLIVRSSGEQRVSNFLLWQHAYSEFYFPATLWPDFDKETVKECILEYQKRVRKFGKVEEE